MESSEVLMMFLFMLAQMALVIGVVFGLSRTKWFKEVIDDRLTPMNCLVFIVVFGALAVAGTYLSADYKIAAVNMRDFPVIIAGFLGGPIIGLGAGIIGGVHRYTEGGVTALPCAIANILSGIVAGLVRMKLKGFPSPPAAVLTSMFLMFAHMILAAFLTEPQELGIDIVTDVTLPMVGFAMLGMAVFSLLYFDRLHQEKVLKDE